MRILDAQYASGFDAVICCDNSLPHLLTESDLAVALASMVSATRQGGVVLATIRDYDRHAAARPVATTPEIAGDRIVFQRWEWLDERVYQASLFILTRDGDRSWSVEHHTGATFRAWQRDEIATVARELGVHAHWLEPLEAGYHQHTLVLRL